MSLAPNSNARANQSPRETGVRFGDDDGLVGVVCEPDLATKAKSPCLILLNSGLVHRIGPGRLYVKLARQLAARGLRSLRFDHGGIGDSDARRDAMPGFDALVSEACQAMDTMQSRYDCDHFALLGLCSGTLVAFRASVQDPRVKATVLLSALLEDPSVVDESTIEKVREQRVARSYWQNKVFDPKSWLRVLSGAADYQRIVNAIKDRLQPQPAVAPVVTKSTQQVLEDLQTVIDRGTQMLFVFSDPSTVFEYYRMTLAKPLGKMNNNSNVKLERIENAGHTFPKLKDQRQLATLIEEWLSQTTD